VHGQSFSFSSSRSQLRSLGLRPRKRLSQSFLEDERIAAAIVRAARIDAAAEVLEVGPGLGVLTRLLVKRARRVVAVELDTDLAENLKAELPEVEVLNEDILRFDPAEHFEGPYTVLANLPYHITSPAIRHLLGGQARRLVVMVQAEVAERISASPGEMSALAVSIQAQAKVHIVRRVPASAFYPRPKVDSAVLVLEPLGQEAPLPREDLNTFVDMVHAGFKQPRKTLANSLADGLHVTREQAVRRLEAARIDPGLRPQALAVDNWVRLFQAEI
jgi:16S rRNA (adenine1518-N6/adenine1519-N6)-dimethyltransferase